VQRTQDWTRCHPRSSSSIVFSATLVLVEKKHLPPATGHVERSASAVETPPRTQRIRSGTLSIAASPRTCRISTGNAGSMEISPLRAAGALRSRRRYFVGGSFFSGYASRGLPPPPATGRVERSGSAAETRWLSRGHASLARHWSCRAKRCDRRERVLLGCAAQSRHLPGPAGPRPGMLVPWRSLHAASIGVEALVETTLVS
jgi:hypothetical protein